VIVLEVRRFFCPAPGCGRKTFAEQVDGLTTRYARKTPLLAGVLGRIAVALAGRAGSRLAAGLGVPASRRVLLRLVMATPDPAATCPRVLGVDDFAIRRGQHYGTLLIDVETGAPLDLLEGRDAQPLADWLADHPGVEVICRDRASAFADRFHLWQNLAKAVEKCVAAHRSCLAEPVIPVGEDDAGPPAEAGPPDPTGRFAERARRKHELVHALRAEGRGLREIARHLGWGLHTVQRYDRAATWQELAESRWPTNRPSKLDPFKPYLDQHAAEGHGSFTRLFHEVKALGYDGSHSVVRNYLDKVRTKTATWARFAATGSKPSLSHNSRYSVSPRAYASIVLGARPRSVQICSHVAACSCRPITGHFSLSATVPLKPAPKSVVAPGEHHHPGRFHVTFKMIKRQMFGRASLPLLRKRVLLTAQS